MLTLALALALAAAVSPAELAPAADAFAAAHPGARLVRAASGGLEHASGLAVPRARAADEENARAFLAAEGRAFGVGGADELALVRVWGGPGTDGGAVFRRTVDGLPVFGGEVAVGWRADGAITVVNGSRALSTGAPRTGFRTGAEDARRRAQDALGLPPGESRVERGWLQFEGELAPAFRVEHGVAGTFQGFVSYVDGDSGALLYRLSTTRTAAPTLHPCPPCPSPPCVCAFRDSPLAPATSDPSGNAPEAFPARDLNPPGDRLVGRRTAAYDCQGNDPSVDNCTTVAPTGDRVPTQLAAPNAQGSFLVDPEPTMQSPRDGFAEQSAYYHIDSHSRFLDSLDPCPPDPRPAGAAPRCFAERTPAGGIGFIPGFVNAYSQGRPYDNAFYSSQGGPSGSSGVMVYGQGTLIDTAYDAEVVYHELTHAAVDVTASFEEFTDRLGVNSEPGAMNEGTADTFAFAHVADALAEVGPRVSSASCLSPYFGAAFSLECLRQAANAKTCRGNGPNDGRNPGRNGEVHDDGEIWTGFTWQLLQAAHDAGGTPARRQMASALFKALQATGKHPTFAGYAATVRQKMADLGMSQAALDYADCTIAQRDLEGCTERTIALFHGERADGVLWGISSQSQGNTVASQQYFVDVPCGATALHLQTGDANGTGGLYLRYGEPIEFTGAGLSKPDYDWALAGNQPDLVLTAGGGCAACNACAGTQTPFGPGRWYLLPYGALLQASNGANQYELGVSIDMPAGQQAPQRVRYTFATAPAAGATNVCTWGGGATPANRAPPVTTALLQLACAAPVAPAALTGCVGGADGGTSGDGGGVAVQQTSTPAKSGCGCGSGSAGGAALLGLVELARRLRRRARGRAA